MQHPTPQKRKSDIARSEVKLKVIRRYRQGNVDTAAILETPGMQPGELCKGELSDINEESGCDTKDEGVPVEVMSTKSFMLKNLQRFRNIEITKDKTLEAKISCQIVLP